MPPKTKAAVPDPQKLAPKDDNLFKQVVRCYETKMYKKALKLADQILKKNPDHGETLAMKGLTLSCIDEKKKDEAYDLVKKGLGKNMKSHVCWHVYGLLYRGDRDYNQAIKCYRNALRHDEDNLSILRDLSLLQIQMRDLKNLTETRRRLLELKPNTKQNWLGFALAHHMQGNYECAYAIMDSYESTMGLPDSKYETSEFLLYRATILLESKQWERCLEALKDGGTKLADKEAILTMTAQCQMGLGQNEDASGQYRELVSMCPENVQFLKGLARTKGVDIQAFHEVVSDEQRAILLPILAELRETYPKSQTIQKAQLDCSIGDDFRAKFVAFLRPYLVRTIPALASAIKSCYFQKDKIPIVADVLHSTEASLEKSGTLPNEEEKMHPLVHVWCWLALSGHYLRTENFDKAMEYCDKAITHTPTIDTLYMHKAKILKHQKKFAEAVDNADLARKMDEADRYNNTKTTRLLLRADRWEEAEKTINLFAFRTPDDEAFSNIVDMQIQWYELELADCYYRLGDVLSACRRYLLIDKHFTDFSEDAFDFHTYCMRKFTMRVYLNMLRNEDVAKNHKFYCYAAQRVVRCYLDLHKIGPEEAESKVLPALKKRAADRPQTKEQKEKDKETEMNVDLKTPLEAAVPFLESLQRFRGSEIATQLLAVELHGQRGRKLHVLQALKRASTLPGAAANADLRTAADAFFAQKHDDLPGPVREVIEEQKKEILGVLK